MLLGVANMMDMMQEKVQQNIQKAKRKSKHKRSRSQIALEPIHEGYWADKGQVGGLICLG